MNKKIIAIASGCSALAVALAGCGGANSGDTKETTTAANNTSSQEVISNVDFETVTIPNLTDTRSEEYKEKTIKTLNGDDVTYNMNTRKIVCVSGS